MRTFRQSLTWISIVGPPALLMIAIPTAAYRDYALSRDVHDYLKLAAEAPTSALAERYLATAVANIEYKGWTSGNTALFFTLPRRDVGLWYQNTKGALAELRVLIAVDSTLSPVDRSNALMKLRETLMDGATVTLPEYLELAPYNALFFWVVVFSALGSINSVAVMAWMMSRSNWTTPIQPPDWMHAARRWIEGQAGRLQESRRRRGR